MTIGDIIILIEEREQLLKILHEQHNNKEYSQKSLQRDSDRIAEIEGMEVEIKDLSGKSEG